MVVDVLEIEDPGVVPKVEHPYGGFRKAQLDLVEATIHAEYSKTCRRLFGLTDEVCKKCHRYLYRGLICLNCP